MPKMDLEILIIMLSEFEVSDCFELVSGSVLAFDNHLSTQ